MFEDKVISERLKKPVSCLPFLSKLLEDARQERNPGKMTWNHGVQPLKSRESNEGSPENSIIKDV
jgi:hypothetical protein